MLFSEHSRLLPGRQIEARDVSSAEAAGDRRDSAAVSGDLADARGDLAGARSVLAGACDDMADSSDDLAAGGGDSVGATDDSAAARGDLTGASGEDSFCSPAVAGVTVANAGSLLISPELAAKKTRNVNIICRHVTSALLSFEL